MSASITIPVGSTKGQAKEITGRAILRGYLALHRDVDHGPDWQPALNGDGWTLTHIESGVALLTGMPAEVGRRALRHLGERVIWRDWQAYSKMLLWRELANAGFDAYLELKALIRNLAEWGYICWPSYGGGWRVDSPYGSFELLDSSLELVIYAMGVRAGRKQAGATKET